MRKRAPRHVKGRHVVFQMRLSLHRALAFTVAIACLSLLGADPGNFARFWTELSGGGRAPKVESLPDFVDLAAKLSPAVVNISSQEADDPSTSGEGEEDEPAPPPGGKTPHNPFEEYAPHARSLGSGFIVSKDGYVLTNDHVVPDVDRITVTTQDGYQYKAKLVGRDEKSDIALLKIQPKRELPVAPLGNSDDVRVGQWVMAIGNPFGFDHSVTVGVVSAKGRFIPGNYDEFIQTDASINPGNSGGPLISIHGDVIAVNSAIYTRTGSNMGIGFAIPVNIVKEELPQLRGSGKVVRGWLGVYIQKMTPELAESLGLPNTSGALIAEVLKNGHVATLKLMRHGRLENIKIVITPSHEEELTSSKPVEKPARGSASSFGLYVKELSPDLAKELGVDQPAGVVISSVQPGSSADEAGLRARDIILEVNREPVRDVTSYQHAMQSGGNGKIVLLLVRHGDSTIYYALKPEA